MQCCCLINISVLFFVCLTYRANKPRQVESKITSNLRNPEHNFNILMDVDISTRIATTLAAFC